MLGLFFRADAVSFKNNSMGPFCIYKRKMRNSLDIQHSDKYEITDFNTVICSFPIAP